MNSNLTPTILWNVFGVIPQNNFPVNLFFLHCRSPSNEQSERHPGLVLEMHRAGDLRPR